MEFLIALPIFGEVLLCFFIVIPICAPIMVILGFGMLFDGDIGDVFLGLFIIALGVGTCIITWPLAWEAIKIAFHLFS